MILLDTHIWVWWVNGSEELSEAQKQLLDSGEADGLGVSVISCWEVAKLVEKERLTLSIPIDIWIESALNYPGVRLINLTPEIVIKSTQLPGDFHKDPADQLLVATARILGVGMMTNDQKIRSYPHVKITE